MKKFINMSLDIRILNLLHKLNELRLGVKKQNNFDLIPYYWQLIPARQLIGNMNMNR